MVHDFGTNNGFDKDHLVHIAVTIMIEISKAVESKIISNVRSDTGIIWTLENGVIVAFPFPDNGEPIDFYVTDEISNLEWLLSYTDHAKNNMEELVDIIKKFA